MPLFAIIALIIWIAPEFAILEQRVATVKQATAERATVERATVENGMVESVSIQEGILIDEQIMTEEYDVNSDFKPLFDFDSTDTSFWQVVNDGVMGGRSSGYVAVEDGSLRFTGTLVTRGGGFTSVRTSVDANLSDYDGLELRVRGGGRTFEIEIDDDTRRWGRSVSRRAPFDTTSEWVVVRVPFTLLRASVFGQRVNADPIDLERVRSLGLYILDGKDGPFRLEVDFIRAYSDSKN